jgi:hypothetical protein
MDKMTALLRWIPPPHIRLRLHVYRVQRTMCSHSLHHTSQSKSPHAAISVIHCVVVLACLHLAEYQQRQLMTITDLLITLSICLPLSRTHYHCVAPALRVRSNQQASRPPPSHPYTHTHTHTHTHTTSLFTICTLAPFQNAQYRIGYTNFVWEIRIRIYLPFWLDKGLRDLHCWEWQQSSTSALLSLSPTRGHKNR